jgi:hypothetical protein
MLNIVKPITLNSFNNYFSTIDLNSLSENACKHQCESIEYKLSLSSFAFPTLSYAQDIKNSFTKFFLSMIQMQN